MKEKKKIIGIIPARMGSTRFPGKPLARIVGVPMLGHVYHRSKLSTSLDEVYIATPDKEIVEYANSIGAKYVITKSTHERASDRTAEAVEKIDSETAEKTDIVVLIQGDEPMLVPEMIDMAIKPMLEDSSLQVINLMAPIESIEEHHDPNCIKVVVDRNSDAMFFSREPIPSRKKWKNDTIPMFKQVCIMPFSRDYLIQFSKLDPSIMEEIESIDMNRALEYGHKVKMVLQNFKTQAVDTPEDLKKVEQMMQDDPLVKMYI